MRLSLNAQILFAALAGLGLGLILAHLPPEDSFRGGTLSLCSMFGQVFIDLLKMVLIPLVFLSIATGVANLSSHAQGRRVWRLTLLFFLTTTTLAVGLGLLAANVFRPGEGLDVAAFREAMGGFNAQKLTLGEFLQKFAHGLFLNPVAAMAEGEVLSTVIFALFVGAALVACGERTQGLLRLMNEAWTLVMEITLWIMRIAPVGIFALLVKLAATQSTALLVGLGKFVAVVLGSTLFHGVVVLPLLLYLATRFPPTRFFTGSREALVTAFATASSSATMPVTLRCARHHFRIDPSISGFVIPLGTTVNMDGTALYESAAALFVAQLSGIELNLMQQGVVFLIAMLAAIGAPGIPSAGMVTLAMVLQSVGLPVEAIAILLPIDRLLDAFRTAVNVEGDLIGSLIVQRWVSAAPAPGAGTSG